MTWPIFYLCPLWALFLAELCNQGLPVRVSIPERVVDNGHLQVAAFRTVPSLAQAHDLDLVVEHVQACGLHALVCRGFAQLENCCICLLVLFLFWFQSFGSSHAKARAITEDMRPAQGTCICSGSRCEVS